MNASTHRTTILASLLLVAVFATPASAGVPVRLPPVPEAPEFGWVRQPFFETLALWDIDRLLFPTRTLDLREQPAGAPARSGGEHLAEGKEKAEQAAKQGNDGRLHEEAARLFLRAASADKAGETGFLALRLAARSFFLGGHFTEASGVATSLIKRSGGGQAALPFYILKGEALYRKRNLLSARECFRRASAGTWNADTAARIALRIADTSLEMGNVAYAEPAYRKVLGSAEAQRKYPFAAVRFGEALLAAGKAEEALVVFGNVNTPSSPPLARSAASLGEGDAWLLLSNPTGATYAYTNLGGFGNFPETSRLIQLRNADLAFASGERPRAQAAYQALAAGADPAVAREAGYKWVLSMYLAGDFPGAVRESQSWLSRNAGSWGEAAMRNLSAKAAAEAVRAAGKSNPADRWPSLSSYLFAYGRTKELSGLLSEIGKEWEEAKIWGGAADVYILAGEHGRGAEMKRISRAEAAYYRGDFPAVFKELSWKDAGAEKQPEALWLAAKTFFRQGNAAEAEAALRRIASLRPSATAGGLPPDREMAAFIRALDGRWEEAGALFGGKEPPREMPGGSLFRSFSGKKSASRDFAGAPPVSNPAAPGRDLYGDYLRVRERFGRLVSEEDAR